MNAMAFSLSFFIALLGLKKRPGDGDHFSSVISFFDTGERKRGNSVIWTGNNRSFKLGDDAESTSRICLVES